MKQTIVARGDLDMGTGKLAAQVAHAALQAAEAADEAVKRQWTSAGQQKVVVRVDSEAAIHELAEAASAANLPYAIVRDAGRTQLEPGTVTALGVGPGEEARVDRVTGDLPLY